MSIQWQNRLQIKRALKLSLVGLFVLAGTGAVAGVKVAFIADQGTGSGARSVLSLIASEGADFLMIQGDLGYDPGVASIWESNLNEFLGRDFPVLTLAGNHEDEDWPRFRELIRARLDRVSNIRCTGEIGIKPYCQYGNIDIVQVAPGLYAVEGSDPDADYASFITSSFASSTAQWRICAWHKNQKDMQTGNKPNETGWAVYEACRRAGAIIATGHEHAYSRTHLLRNFENQDVVHKNDEMAIIPG